MTTLKALQALCASVYAHGSKDLIVENGFFLMGRARATERTNGFCQEIEKICYIRVKVVWQ